MRILLAGAKIDQDVIWNWWRQAMMGGIKAQYDCIKAFSETDFTEDLKAIQVRSSLFTETTIRSCLCQLGSAFSQAAEETARRRPIPDCRMDCPRPA